MTINEIQDEIIEEFAGLDDWMDKYQLLIDLGNEQEPLEDQYKTEQNLIDGCQSRVWLVAELVNQGDSPHDLPCLRSRRQLYHQPQSALSMHQHTVGVAAYLSLSPLCDERFGRGK